MIMYMFYLTHYIKMKYKSPKKYFGRTATCQHNCKGWAGQTLSKWCLTTPIYYIKFVEYRSVIMIGTEKDKLKQGNDDNSTFKQI